MKRSHTYVSHNKSSKNLMKRKVIKTTRQKEKKKRYVSLSEAAVRHSYLPETVETKVLNITTENTRIKSNVFSVCHQV